MPHLAFAHSVDASALRPENTALREALAARGIACELANWTDPNIDWRRFDAVFLKTCSDYYLACDDFMHWLARLDALGVPTINASETVRWNINKRYLQSIERAGFPIIPTRFISQGNPCNLAAELDAQGWSEAIIKPCISAGSHDTFRFLRAEADAFNPKAAAILTRCDLMIQPFMPKVVDEGEWSLLFMGNRFIHAVLKPAKAGDFRIQDIHGGTYSSVEPPAALIAMAGDVLTLAPSPPAYARVDGVMDDNGSFRVMEVELIEPFLYSTVCETIIPALADAMATNIISRQAIPRE